MENPIESAVIQALNQAYSSKSHNWLHSPVWLLKIVRVDLSALKSKLYNPALLCKIVGMNWKKFLPLLPVLLLAGCTTASFTRVTPLQQPRNANNLYPVEVIFNSEPAVVALGQPQALRSGQWRTLSAASRADCAKTAGKVLCRCRRRPTESCTVSNLNISTTPSARNPKPAATFRRCII